MAQQHRRALRSTTKISPRASRLVKPTISYRELSSEIETESSEKEALQDSTRLVDIAPKRRSVRRGLENTHPSRNRRQPSPSPAPSNSSVILYETRKRKRPTCSHTSRHGLVDSPSSHSPFQQDSCSTGAIPPWASLPYQILVQIFHYASYPLYDERNFQPFTSVDWLVKTSRLCRAFTEPALTILYRSPPLIPMDRAHRFRQLLVADPEPMAYKYRAKVERLQIEVSHTATYTLPGSGILDLYGLIYHCPRLLDLELYHQKDFSPYRSLDESIKWTYPESLFCALNRNVSGVPTSLRSWRWSSRLAGKKRSLESLLEIHQSPSFSRLRKIAFVNYQKALVRKNAVDPRHENILAESLSVLSNLEHLVVESSSLANSILLPLLPVNLKRLELINCLEVTSDDLAGFLASHGSQLRSLILNHNQSLKLSFLTTLGSACPHLETLKINLTYYNVYPTYRDSRYETILDLDEKPHWPSSLRTIELIQLRKWDIDTAKMFFQSLLESADTLPNLRRLVVKATLDTNWRDRSSFRDEWVGAFERVFKRPFMSPNSHLQSLKAYKDQQGKIAHRSVDKSDDGILCPPLEVDGSTAGAEDPNAGESPKRRLRSANKIHSESVRNGMPSLARRDARDYTKEKESHGTGKPQRRKPTTRRSARHEGVSLSLSDADEYQPEEKLRSQNGLHKHDPLAYSSRPKINDPSFCRTNREQLMIDQLRQEIFSDTSTDDAGLDYYSDSDNIPLASRRQIPGEKQSGRVQGMCDVVSITIDNLRPTETQFVEEDFLDSEPEGDEDWDGTEDFVGDVGYAW